MSERDEYPAGVPCWVEGLHRDVDAAVAFYGQVMGWEIDDEGRGEFMARLRGRDVAGMARMPDEVKDSDSAWMTHVAVDSADGAAEAATAAGGTVLAGPMDLSPEGTLVVIADPEGAVIGAWEAGRHQGAQLVNEAGAWSISALNTADPDRAKAFYGDLFGWETEDFGPPGAGIAVFRLPGYFGGEPSQPVPRDVVAAMAPLAEGPARWSVDFWIADADAAAAKTQELGGSILSGPEDAPPFREAVLADPQGAEFAVSQMVAPPD